MTDQHPITPPAELVELWITEVWREGTPVRVAASDLHIATQAARWGADQELEACCGLIGSAYVRDQVRDARRPKPPSLKEQALAIVTRANRVITDEEQNTIRLALEQLND